MNLGNFARGDRPELAVAQYQRAIEQWEILCQPAIVQPEHLEWYARTLGNLGLLMTEKGNPAGAVPILTDAARNSFFTAYVPLCPEQRSITSTVVSGISRSRSRVLSPMFCTRKWHGTW